MIMKRIFQMYCRLLKKELQKLQAGADAPPAASDEGEFVTVHAHQHEGTDASPGDKRSWEELE